MGCKGKVGMGVVDMQCFDTWIPFMFFFLCCTQFILITCRKWRPPETDEEKQLKKQRAQESKKRKKEAKEVKEEDWSWYVDALLQIYIGSIS